MTNFQDQRSSDIDLAFVFTLQTFHITTAITNTVAATAATSNRGKK